MTEETPGAVIEAAAMAICDQYGSDRWSQLSEDVRDAYRRDARVAAPHILAAELAARRACYRAGWADAVAALMVAANTAIEHCEATAASFRQERGSAAETGARLMTAQAQQIRNIIADVQAAQAAKGNEPDGS